MEEPQSHLTAPVTKFQIQEYVKISIKIKIMNLRIKEVTRDTPENYQHSSLTNYTNCKHPFLVLYIKSFIVLYHIHMIYGVSKTTGGAAIINDQLNTEF